MLMGCLLHWPPIICWTFVTSLVCWEFSRARQHCCMCLANAAQKSWNQCASQWGLGPRPELITGPKIHLFHASISRNKWERINVHKTSQWNSINSQERKHLICLCSVTHFFPCVKNIVDGQAPGRPMGTASWTKNSWNCVGQHPSIFVSFILCKYTCLYFMWFHNVSYACSGRLRLIIAWNIIFFLGSKNHLLGPGGVSIWFWVVFPPKSNRGFLHRPAWVGQGGWATLGWQPFSNQKSV